MSVHPWVVGAMAAAALGGLAGSARAARRATVAALRTRLDRVDEVGARSFDLGWVERFRPTSSESGEPVDLLRLRAALVAGGSLLQAFDAVGRADGAWSSGARDLVRRVRLGTGIHRAIEHWVDQDADPDLALLADALAIAQSTGGSQADALGAVISVARDRQALRREVRALASQARASAAVMVLMPLGFALAVAVIDPRVRHLYLGTIVGPVAVAVGLVLDAAGAWWMARLVARVS